MNVESAIYGALMGIAIVFVMWRMGIRMTPWPEALLGVLLAIAIWLVLKLAGVDNALGITIGVLVGSFIVSIRRRFAHRRADGGP
ncbi:MAG: hypothetical protein M3T56_00445 [Chloroflexota bacterium]|nr:hypothetical protein [Chloroflexota bacterium]